MINSEKIYLIGYIDSKNNYSKRIVTNNEKYFEKYYEQLNQSENNKTRTTETKKTNSNIPLIIMVSERKNEKLEIGNLFRTLDSKKITILNSVDINMEDFNKESFENLYNVFKDIDYLLNENNDIEEKFIKLGNFIKNNIKLNKKNLQNLNKSERSFLKMKYENNIDINTDIKFY